MSGRLLAEVLRYLSARHDRCGRRRWSCTCIHPCPGSTGDSA